MVLWTNSKFAWRLCLSLQECTIYLIEQSYMNDGRQDFFNFNRYTKTNFAAMAMVLEKYDGPGNDYIAMCRSHKQKILKILRISLNWVWNLKLEKNADLHIVLEIKRFKASKKANKNKSNYCENIMYVSQFCRFLSNLNYCTSVHGLKNFVIFSIK